MALEPRGRNILQGRGGSRIPRDMKAELHHGARQAPVLCASSPSCVGTVATQGAVLERSVASSELLPDEEQVRWPIILFSLFTFVNAK